MVASWRENGQRVGRASEAEHAGDHLYSLPAGNRPYFGNVFPVHHGTTCPASSSGQRPISESPVHRQIYSRRAAAYMPVCIVQLASPRFLLMVHGVVHKTGHAQCVGCIAYRKPRLRYTDRLDRKRHIPILNRS